MNAVSIIPAVTFNRLSAGEQLTALTSHKAQTLNATVANIFAAAAKHDRLIEAALERTARENPRDAGDILWV